MYLPLSYLQPVRFMVSCALKTSVERSQIIGQNLSLGFSYIYLFFLDFNLDFIFFCAAASWSSGDPGSSGISGSSESPSHSSSKLFMSLYQRLWKIHKACVGCTCTIDWPTLVIITKVTLKNGRGSVSIEHETLVIITKVTF